MLVDKCLRKDLEDRLLQESPEYLTTMKVIEKMYSSVVAKAPDSKRDYLLASYSMHTLEEGVAKICSSSVYLWYLSRGTFPSMLL